MIRIMICVLASLALAGCGSDRTQTSVLPVRNKSAGTYQLVQKKVAKSHQCVPFAEYSSLSQSHSELTEKLKIGATSWDKEQTINAQLFTVTGTHNFTATLPLTGSFSLSIPNRVPISGVFNISDYNTAASYLFWLTYDPTIDGDGCTKLTEVWSKIIDAP